MTRKVLGRRGVRGQRRWADAEWESVDVARRVSCLAQPPPEATVGTDTVSASLQRRRSLCARNRASTEVKMVSDSAFAASATLDIYSYSGDLCRLSYTLPSATCHPTLALPKVSTKTARQNRLRMPPPPPDAVPCVCKCSSFVGPPLVKPRIGTSRARLLPPAAPGTRAQSGPRCAS